MDGEYRGTVAALRGWDDCDEFAHFVPDVARRGDLHSEQASPTDSYNLVPEIVHSDLSGTMSSLTSTGGGPALFTLFAAACRFAGCVTSRGAPPVFGKVL